MSGYCDFAAYYDKLTSNIDYEEIAEYYDNTAARFGGRKGVLLDLACGTGSLSVCLSKLGYDVIGADCSPDMLSIAVSKEHEGITYICQDMCELELYGAADVVICALDSFNHLESEEQLRQAVSRIAEYTESGALLMFDVNTPYKHENVLGDNTFVYDCDDVYCVWQNYNEGGGVTAIELDFFVPDEDGKYSRYTDGFTETAYPLSLYREILAENGFEILAEYDYLTYEPVREDSEKATFAARKK